MISVTYLNVLLTANHASNLRLVFIQDMDTDQGLFETLVRISIVDRSQVINRS